MNTIQPEQPGFQSGVSPRSHSPIAVEVLVCGSPDRGDDGAPLAVVDHLRAILPSDVAVRTVGQLDIDHLVWVRDSAAVVVVDAATGIDPGTITTLPLGGLIDRPGRIQPRSSHALAIPEVVGLAEMIRHRPLAGRIVAIGGQQFGLGLPVSRQVALALPALSLAILDAVEQVRRTDDRPQGSAQCA